MERGLPPFARPWNSTDDPKTDCKERPLSRCKPIAPKIFCSSPNRNATRANPPCPAIVGENERGDNKCCEPSKILRGSPRFNNRRFFYSPLEFEKLVTRHCRKKETFRAPAHLLGSIVMKPLFGGMEFYRYTIIRFT